MATWSSPLPVGCRATSNFGPRGGVFHAGDDFGPPKPGQQGVPVFAVAAGTVVDTGNGNVLKGHSGNGVLIDHGSKVRSYSGHLASFSVSPGQKVKAGQKIGVMGYTGNVKPSGSAGTHLHLGILINGTFVDPSVFLGSRGVVVGKTKPVAQSTPAPANPDYQRNVNIQNAMKAMGFYKGVVDGRNGPMQIAAVKAFQKKYGLVPDGVYGPKTEAKWKSLQKPAAKPPAAKVYTSVHRGSQKASVIRQVQQALRKNGYTKQIVDGVFGDQTFVNVKDWQRRKGLRQDGIAGAITQKSLGL
jgi:murein DD-endopeptidase MepM/ murein hydrolase activator NlpD